MNSVKTQFVWFTFQSFVKFYVTSRCLPFVFLIVRFVFKLRRNENLLDLAYVEATMSAKHPKISLEAIWKNIIYLSKYMLTPYHFLKHWYQRKLLVKWCCEKCVQKAVFLVWVRKKIRFSRDIFFVGIFEK